VTDLDFQSRGVVAILRDTIRERGVKGLYSGSGALIAGNGLKAGVRFLTYDTIKGYLRTPEVSLRM
jgi:solute carrier family 25 citrate transporter 1